MTNDAPAQAPETVPDPAVGPDATPTGSEAGEQAVEGGDGGGNREAAKYRTKLRAAEAERDSLAATVVTFQRAEVERLLRTRLETPGDFWLAGANLEDQLTEDGTVDPAKVEAAAQAVLADHPSWAARRKPRVPRDMGQGTREGQVGGVRSLQQILRG